MGLDDVVTDVTDHPKVGFDPDVCEGCPMRVTSKADVTPEMHAAVQSMPNAIISRMLPCGLCGCPTRSGLLMDQTGRPPEDCWRIDEHGRG